MSPENWIKLLYLYGPMALFAFTVFVLLGKARNTTGLSKDQQLIQNVAFLLVWVFIFALAVTIVIIWWRINLPREWEIRGFIHNLRNSETISTRDDLFLKKIYKTDLDVDYEWRILSASAPTEPVAFLLQENNNPNDAASKDFLTYRIPVSDRLYHGTVEISYDRSTKNMSLTDGDYKTLLQPESPTASRVTNESGTVHADSTPSPDVLIKALDSNDPVIRENAKKDLISFGRSSLDAAQKALIDSNSSVRLRAEALSVIESIVGPSEIKKKDWHPVELASNPNLGVFVVSKEGDVSQLSFDSSGGHLRSVTNIPRAYEPVSIAVDDNAVYLSTRWMQGCEVFRYVPVSNQRYSFAIPDLECAGIAADGHGFYISGGPPTKIVYWSRWGESKDKMWDWSDLKAIGPLSFDASGNRLLAGDSEDGTLYSASISSLSAKRLASNLGWVNSVTCDALRILVASGRKVLFLNRWTGTGQNPPPHFRIPKADVISGVALDIAGNLWICDYGRGSVFGPVPLN